MNRVLLVAAGVALTGCGGHHNATDRHGMRDGVYAVRVTGATIESRRPDGSPWHVTSGDSSAAVLGVAAGVVAGNAELGTTVGDALGAKGGDPEAPIPYVVLKLGGASWTIGPTERSYSPTWNQAVEIRTWSYRGDEQVIIQVLDAVDHELLAQGAMPLSKLLSEPTQTLTNLKGSVPTLDLDVAVKTKSELDDGPRGDEAQTR